MTDMTKLRNALRPFLADGVNIIDTNLGAGLGIVLVNRVGLTANFIPIGDDHTYLSVIVGDEDLT